MVRRSRASSHKGRENPDVGGSDYRGCKERTVLSEKMKRPQCSPSPSLLSPPPYLQTLPCPPHTHTYPACNERVDVRRDASCCWSCRRQASFLAGRDGVCVLCILFQFYDQRLARKPNTQGLPTDAVNGHTVPLPSLLPASDTHLCELSLHSLHTCTRAMRLRHG